jgi:hypothetical protein
VILGHRFRTRRLLRFDERDFRAVVPLSGGSFTLLLKRVRGQVKAKPLRGADRLRRI